MTELTKEHVDKQFEKMAVMIAKGFEATSTKTEVKGLENRLDKLEGKVDIIQGKLDNILYKEINNLDSRVHKIEKHLGFTTA